MDVGYAASSQLHETPHKKEVKEGVEKSERKPTILSLPRGTFSINNVLNLYLTIYSYLSDING